MLPKQVRSDLRNLKDAPRWIVGTLILVHIIGLVPLALAARARVTKSPTNQIHIVPNMDNQPKFKAQSANPLFKDGRGMRPPIEGTVARGELFTDEAYFRGRDESGEFVAGYPSQVTPITRDFVLRGQERYAVYCAPCHGASGDGNGMVTVRAVGLGQGWTIPTSYHSDELRAKPVGSLFNTISNGVRNMPGYASQIPVRDRWAIVSYVRALQASQWADLSELPAEKRRELEERRPPPK